MYKYRCFYYLKTGAHLTSNDPSAGFVFLTPVQPDNFPYKEEIAALSNVCLVFIVLLFIGSILGFKVMLSYLKGAFQTKIKSIIFFILPVVLSISVDCFGMSCRGLEISTVKMLPLSPV